MAFALTGMYVAINSVDVSSLVKSAQLTMEAAQLDSTAMGSGWTSVIGGLKSGSLTVTFNDDFSDDGLDEDLQGIFGTVVTFEIRPDDASVGPTNPKYTGSILVSGQMFGGQVGDLAAKTFTWPTSGAITRTAA